MDFYTNNHNPHKIYHTEAGTKITAKIVLGSYFEKKISAFSFKVMISMFQPVAGRSRHYTLKKVVMQVIIPIHSFLNE